KSRRRAKKSRRQEEGLPEARRRRADSGPPRLSLASRRKWAIFRRSTPTSDVELARWAARHIPKFGMVLPRDELPEQTLEPGKSFIINLDPEYKRGGTHWCAVYVCKESPTVFYWDPFGLPPPRAVPLWAWRNGRGVVRSNAKWQSFSVDQNCGPRCLAALYD